MNAGSRWISFNWNMSETACVFALSRLMLRVTDTYSENTVSFALPKNCSDQSNIADTQNCFANITSTMRLTEQESVLPCTLYDIVVFPQIGGIDYTQNKTSFTAKTTPGNCVMRHLIVLF